MLKIKSALIIFFLSLTSPAFTQEVDIVPFLKEIEDGNKESAKANLAGLQKKFPNDPSVKFLKGVLMEDGGEAVAIYSEIVKSHSRSKYADASLYRIYSYYYALGLYDNAKNYLTRLKKDYPQSPYIKIADRKIPSDDDIAAKIETRSGKEEKNDTKNFKFTIQAGAFGNFGNASALKKDFEKSGFESEIKEKNVGGTVFNVVYVGKFTTSEEAKSFLQVINSEFNLDGRVIDINSIK